MFLRDCSHFGIDTRKIFEKLTTFPLDVFTHSSFPIPCVKHKDTKDGPCLQEHITHQNSLKESVQIQSTDNQKEEIGKNKKISPCFGWKCIFPGIRLSRIYSFNLNAYQGVSMMTSMDLEVPQSAMATAWQTGSEKTRWNTEMWGWNGVKELYLVCHGWGLNRAQKRRNPTWQSQGCNQIISHAGNEAVKLRRQGKSWEDKSAGEARKDKSSCNLDPCKSRGKDWVKGQKSICYRSINI